MFVGGEKEVLGLWIEQTEGAKFLLKVINELKTRSTALGPPNGRLPYQRQSVGRESHNHLMTEQFPLTGGSI